MTFESEYVPKIAECFRKLQTMAMERELELQEAGQHQQKQM